MQPYTVPHPGRTPGPNIVNNHDYKMHVLKRQYSDGEWEILIERWIPETGWTRTQLLMSQTEFDKLRQVLAE
jgi:hypothetical protein